MPFIKGNMAHEKILSVTFVFLLLVVMVCCAYISVKYPGTGETYCTDHMDDPKCKTVTWESLAKEHPENQQLQMIVAERAGEYDNLPIYRSTPDGKTIIIEDGI